MGLRNSLRLSSHPIVMSSCRWVEQEPAVEPTICPPILEPVAVAEQTTLIRGPMWSDGCRAWGQQRALAVQW